MIFLTFAMHWCRFLAHLPSLNITETPTNIKHAKIYPESNLFCSVKLPLSILFQRACQLYICSFQCEVEPWSAVLPSGQGMQWRSVSFLKWSGGHIWHWVPEPCLSCSSVCLMLLCNSTCSQLSRIRTALNKQTSKKMQEDTTAIWRKDPKIQIILNPDLCSLDSSQGCSYTVFSVQRGWVWLPAGCWWD